MSKLVIVESPTKAKKIAGFLGKDWKVKASAGHVRDLPSRPKNGFGIDLSTWTPEYEVNPDKAKLLKDLKAAVKEADEVFLATDPDREGEAIAYGLKTLLGKGKYRRATWQEITKKAVENGLASAREINMALVEAQEARRIVDRLVGFGISPWLQQAMQRRDLSAGRVQSVALRLVVERQRQIDNFVSKPYAGVTLDARHGKNEFRAELSQVSGERLVSPKDAGKPGTRVLSEEEARRLVLPRPGDMLAVVDVQRTTERRAPKAPFTTSELMEGASAALGFSPDQTAKLSQDLHQAGAISYHRTDSPALSDEATEMARQIVGREHGERFLPTEPRKYKAKGNAQEAHEAIRPTHDDAMPAGVQALGREHMKLYELIWRRFLACQMADVEADVTTVDLIHGDLLFRARGRVVTFSGWQAVYGAAEDHEDGEDGEDGRLPSMPKGEKVEAIKSEIKSKKTEPPSAFTEGKLVKELEARGIGRPATYPQIFRTLKEREFVVLKKRGRGNVLSPTPLGFQIVDVLVKAFPKEMAYEFTASIEGQLDQIAEGNLNKGAMLNAFWPPLAESIGWKEGVGVPRPEAGPKITIKCFKCAADLLVKQYEGRHYVKCEACNTSYGTDAYGNAMGGACKACRGPVRLYKGGNKVCAYCGLNQGPPPPVVKLCCPKCKVDLKPKVFDGQFYVACEACKVSWGINQEGKPLGGYCSACSGPVQKTRKGSLFCVTCEVWLDTPGGKSRSNKPTGSHSTSRAGQHSPSA